MRNSFGFDMMDSKKIILSTKDTKKHEEKRVLSLRSSAIVS